MKPFQSLLKTNSTLHAFPSAFLRTRPHHPPHILNNLARTPPHRPISTRASASAPPRKPISPNLRSQRCLYSTPSKPPYNPTPHLTSPPSLTLSQRFRKLTREYGWSAFGVYIALSALDFPFCFLAVRYLGTDRIGRYERVVVDWIKSVLPEAVIQKFRELKERVFRKEDVPETGAVTMGGEGKVVYGEIGEVLGYDHGVKEAEKLNKSENASIWTQLALAYAIHKSFIFIRVPLTAAVTPKVVKTLRGWGWDIGKRKPKGSK